MQTPEHCMAALDQLEAESIYVLRECVARMSKPVILFSGGKDSLVLLRLSEKAFRPGAFPYPILHIDTGHNFEEALSFRDRVVKRLGEKLIVRKVADSIASGRVQDEFGAYPSRNRIQSVTLLDTLKEFGFDVAIGGARRDEEKARAKERFFSHRNRSGVWNPSAQRPELWNLYNSEIFPDEHMRVFPLNNWTELDVWNYIRREKMEVPSLYFSHKRKCVKRADGSWLAHSPFIRPPAEDVVQECTVRFRTVGDMTCTSPVFSEAKTLDEVIREIETSEMSERGSRADDQRSESAMEERKREGYF